MPVRAIRNFLKLEASAGIILMFAAAVAIILDNSPLASYYDALLGTKFTIALGEAALSKPLLLWINDGLMAVFFLLIGLEIKREILEGQLSNREQILLPTIAAIGGMVIPALVYAAFNYQDPAALNGWAIPAATDIAFALGVMALLGSRVPLSLKILLTAIAIIDDLGAIIIIAIFYTSGLSFISLVLAAIALIGLVLLNQFKVTALTPYMLIGLLLWVFVLKSGVHATLAGVALGLAIPLRGASAEDHSPLRYLEHALHPWVAYMILPVFAFANAGVSLSGVTLEVMLAPVTLGIAAGLFIGKQIGVFGFCWVAVKSGLCKLPAEVTWRHMHGLSLLAGVGFTMSLFIGTLAFADTQSASAVRLGVISGSILAAVCGYLVLRLAPGASPRPTEANAEKIAA